MSRSHQFRQEPPATCISVSLKPTTLHEWHSIWWHTQSNAYRLVLHYKLLHTRLHVPLSMFPAAWCYCVCFAWDSHLTQFVITVINIETHMPVRVVLTCFDPFHLFCTRGNLYAPEWRNIELYAVVKRSR